MLNKLILDETLSQMLERNSSDMIMHLLESGVEFGVICDTSAISFDPPLPQDIMANIRPIALFLLSGYSFESAQLGADSVLYFEAGFGSENFGSLVSVPIEQVIQIVVEDTPIFINITAGQKRKQPKKPMQEEGVEHSMRCLMSNPENQKFLKS